MGRKCFICKGHGKNQIKKMLFKIPRKSVIRKVWLKFCDLPETCLMNIYLCDTHFHKSDILGKGNHLKQGSIPTIKIVDGKYFLL